MTKKVNTELARQLREEGLSYKDIAKELDCSIDWCKRNLQGITKNKIREERIKELVLKAQQPEALTKAEVRSVILEIDKPDSNLSVSKFNQEVSSKVNIMVTKINSYEGTIVRPTWMNPINAISCYYKLAELAMVLDEQLEEHLNDYFRDTGTEDISGTRHSLLLALLHISKASKVMNVNPIPIMNHYENVALKLVDRNGDSGLVKSEPYGCLYKEDEIPY